MQRGRPVAATHGRHAQGLHRDLHPHAAEADGQARGHARGVRGRCSRDVAVPDRRYRPRRVDAGESISDLRDESDREGMRIVIELKKDAFPQVVLIRNAENERLYASRQEHLEELEHRYRLTYGFLPGDFDRLVVRLDEILAAEDPKAEWGRRRQRMLAEKINPTDVYYEHIRRYLE